MCVCVCVCVCVRVRVCVHVCAVFMLVCKCTFACKVCAHEYAYYTFMGIYCPKHVSVYVSGNTLVAYNHEECRCIQAWQLINKQRRT